MKKTLLIFGTRPEWIKLLPVIREYHKRQLRDQLLIVHTGQHDSLLNAELPKFGIQVDHQLLTKREGSGLNQLLAQLLCRFEQYLRSLSQQGIKVDNMLVQGDTASAYSAALTAFHHKIPLLHLEAGLRTHNLQHPYPEEFYRRSISQLASLHFVPSTHARDNLLAEGVEESDIQLVGNTVIDNLFHYISSPPSANARTVLITLHRRTFCEAERHQYLAYFERLISANPQYRFRWLQHPSQPLSELVPAHPNLQFLDPLPFLEMLRQYQDTCLILTDSGGVQEEAAYLGIPCIVARKMTERQESLEAGVSKLIDLRQRDIPQILANFESEKLLFRNPLYGGGDSATQVVDACLNYQIYD